MRTTGLVLIASLIAASPVGSATRIMLSSGIDLFISTQADALSDCLSAETACSPQRAVARASTLDYGGQTITIRAIEEGEPKTYRGNILVPSQVGGGTLTFSGAPAPNKTTFDGNGADCFTLFDVGSTKVNFRDLRLTTTGGLGSINVVSSTAATIDGGVDFGPSANAHVWVHDKRAEVTFLKRKYVISGPAKHHIFDNGGQVFHEEAEGRCIIDECVFHAFATVVMNGALQTTGSKFPGKFKGMRYHLYSGGRINALGAPPDYLPGDQAGQVEKDDHYR